MPISAEIASNIDRVLKEIAESAVRAGREPSSVRLLAVSKTFPAARIREAYDCGLREFGENRVQEFQDKLPQLRLPGIIFHLIGHLQSNKVRPAIGFDWVQTVDSDRIARRLHEAAEEAGKSMPVLIEVKLEEEPAKSGVAEGEVARLAEAIAKLERLELRGLMTLPPFSPNPEESRPYFRRLRELRDQLRQKGLPQMLELSMGMTRDFPIAIEEGATIVRIGTGIFGPRPTPTAAPVEG